MFRHSTLLACFIVATTACFASNVEAIDDIYVTMTKSQVTAVLGAPQNSEKIDDALQVAIYEPQDSEPLIGAAMLYDEDDRLVASTLVFDGNLGAVVEQQLRQKQFQFVQRTEDALLMRGQDDDTARPIMVVITQQHGVTTVMSMEQSYYEQEL